MPLLYLCLTILIIHKHKILTIFCGDYNLLELNVITECDRNIINVKRDRFIQYYLWSIVI